MRNHYPAIDVLGSVSRLMNDITEKEQIEAAGRMRNLMSVYDANYDLVNIGAYKSGTNKALDEAISKMDKVNEFLQQNIYDKIPYDESVEMMKGAVL
jgi:flagellum-specific ATP synthase